MATCAAMVDDGVIRGVLATLDCQTRAYAQGGYLALTSSSGVFQAALTAVLTIYVALVGYRMLFAQGNARLSDLPGIALTIGGVLLLVTSWANFQTIVFDLVDRAPVEIAGLVSAPLQGSSLAAHPVDGLQAVYDELSNTGAAYGKLAGVAARAYSSPQAAAAEAVSTASGALFLMSAGVISAATLTTGILTAVGPVFIVLFLIPATRGLFVGWVRAMAAAALTPMVAWLLIVLMLSVLEPWITTLAEQRRTLQLDPQTAMSTAALVFVFTAGQLGLVGGAGIMAFGFHLPDFGARRREGAAEPARAAQAANAAIAISAQPSRAERLALDLQRDQAQTAARARAASTAAAAAATRQVSVTVGETGRLGDAYRRPPFTARRAGGTAR